MMTGLVAMDIENLTKTTEPVTDLDQPGAVFRELI
jgi:hypothetical protein